MKMRPFLFSFVCYILITLSSAAAETGKLPFCYSEELLEQSLRQQPDLEKWMQRQDKAIRDYTAQARIGLANFSGGSFIIPVVVYVVYDPALSVTGDIPDQRVLDQLAGLNTMFSSCGIKFCLATTTMQGSTSIDLRTLAVLPTTSTTPGIFHVQSSLTDHHIATEEGLLKGLSPSLPAARYLRIWVVKNIDNGSGVVGYAQFPGTVPPALDGIVMRYDFFGDATTLPHPNYDQGKILAHEAGHYLNLYHTFHAGCAGMSAADCATEGDRVCDTPPVAVANTGCPTTAVDSCIETPNLSDLLINHMDYTDDTCRNMFTTGQGDRMNATLTLIRSPLVSPQNLVYTGVQCFGGLNPAFAANSYTPCLLDVVSFTEANNPAGTTYSWDFGDGNSGTGNSPTHPYSTPGAYVVTLTVTLGNDSVSSSDQIFVSACSPINSSQGNWYFGTEVGLNFASGTPVADVLNSQMTAGEGCITVSDASGALQFYSDGVTVYGKNHQPLNDPQVNPLFGHKSNSQTAIAFPDPNDSTRHYIFTIGPMDQGQSELYYTLVTTDSQGVQSLNPMNVPVPIPGGAKLNEQITAVPNCDGSGYWVIVHDKTGTGGLDNFLAYQITESSGVSASPSISHVALPATIGVIKASPNGRMIAQATRGGGGPMRAAIFNFNQVSGSLTLRSVVDHGSYGCSFSPDSKLLYMGGDFVQPSGPFAGTVYQYDLTVADGNLNGTAILIASLFGGIDFLPLQLGPDGKIYFSLNGSHILPVINFPNLRCTAALPNACGFTLNGPSLGAGNELGGLQGLPNMVDALPSAQIPLAFSYTIFSCLTLNFTGPSCQSSYAWNFGDATTSSQENPTHIYSAPGTYTITLTVNGTTPLTQTITLGITAQMAGPAQACPPFAQPYYNYSAVNSQAGLQYTWSVTGGTISGPATANNINVVWTTLPVSGTVTLTVTDPVTGCSSTTSLLVTQDEKCCAPPPANMVLWLPLDEASGPTAANLFLDGNSGTHVNGPVVANGYVGRSLSFDGANTYVEVPSYDGINFGISDFSIDAWLKPINSASGIFVILDKRDELASRGYHVFLYNGELGLQLADGAYVNYLSGLMVPQDGLWHHAAVTVRRNDSTGIRFYLDGIPGVTTGNPTTRPGSVSTTSPLRIGSRFSSVSGVFRGGIDEVELFSRVLEQAEIAALFNAGSSGKCKPACYLQITTATPLGSYPACPGESVTFSTTAGGPGPFTYVWTHGVDTIAGANGPSYTIPAAVNADSGVYCVTVTGTYPGNVVPACGTVTRCAVLCVSTPPTATPLNNVSVCAGQSATFTTTTVGGGHACAGQIELPLYYWTHNGNGIPNAFSPTYTIQSVTPADAGIYCFTVVSACGTVQQCATLEVATPLINCPSDIIVDCETDNGARVLYGPVTASSPCCPGGVPNPPICTPESGSLFPIGVTPVTCTVIMDACGNSATKTFTVTVKGKGGHEWQCARRDGGTGEESGNAIAVDRMGNIYVAGAYASPSLFGTTGLPGYGGGKNIFVAKYDAQCNLLWVTSEGRSLDDIARGVAVDATGNIYVTGSFQSSGVGNGPYGLTSAGQSDVFVAKYDPLGNLVWAKSFGGTGSDSAMGIAVDSAGKCYVAGEFQGSFVVGTTKLTSIGAKDCFVVKYDSSGPVLWAAQSAATAGSFAGARAVAVGSSGDAYVTGQFQGTVSFGPHSVVRPGGRTVFVAKCGPSGWVWATHSGHDTATRDHDGRGIGVDANGFCYVTAYFNGTADFGLHPASLKPVAASNNKKPQTSEQLYDYLVAKFLASDGSPIWIVKGGGPLDDDEEPSGLAVDAVGNCYITGFLHPDAPTRYVRAGQNVLVAKYNSGGVPQWSSNPTGALASDGVPDNIGLGIAADGAGCVYVTGAFTESLNFPGLTPLVNSLASPTDVFVAKLCPDCAPLVSCPPNAHLTKIVYFDISGHIPPIIELSWSATGYRLQCTDSLTNPTWIDVPGSSPVTVPTSSHSKFFRLVCP